MNLDELLVQIDTAVYELESEAVKAAIEADRLRDENAELHLRVAELTTERDDARARAAHYAHDNRML